MSYVNTYSDGNHMLSGGDFFSIQTEDPKKVNVLVFFCNFCCYCWSKTCWQNMQ